METYLSTSTSPVPLESRMQKDSTPFADNNVDGSKPITDADIRKYVLRLSSTLPYRSRRQSVQLINQIASALDQMTSEIRLDSQTFQQLFEIVSDCWLSIEIEPVVISLLTSALRALPKPDLHAKLGELAQQAFDIGLAPVERCFILRMFSAFPTLAPSLLAQAFLNSDASIDLQTLRYALLEFWKTSKYDPNFNDELQLMLIASRIFSSNLAPALLDLSLMDWLDSLSTSSSEWWSSVGCCLQRLLNYPSETVREWASQCFCHLFTVRNSSFAHCRLSTLFDTSSLNALKDEFILPEIGTDHFWTTPSVHLALRNKQASGGKILVQEEYINVLDHLFKIKNVADLNGVRCLLIDAATTLVHDKLRTLGSISSTLEDIVHRLAQHPIGSASNIAVLFFLYALNLLIQRIASQYPELQVPFPSVIPFFLSKQFIHDGFFEKVSARRLHLALSCPCAVQRSVFIAGIVNTNFMELALALCWALKESEFLKMDIMCISQALDSDDGICTLANAVKYHSQDAFEAASDCYFDAIQRVSSVHKDLSWTGVVQCVRALQSWDTIPQELLYPDGSDDEVHELLLRSSFLLHTCKPELALQLLENNWPLLNMSGIQQMDPTSTMLIMCQLWITRLQSLGLQSLQPDVVTQASEFASEMMTASSLCSSYAQSQRLLANYQLLSYALNPSFNIEHLLQSSAFQNLPVLSDLFMIHPSQKVLACLILKAKETDNPRFLSRLLKKVDTYGDPIIPELRHSVLVSSELSEASLLDFWSLSESSQHTKITLSLIESLLRSPVHDLSVLCHHSLICDPALLIDQAFQHVSDLSIRSHYAKWCVDQTGILGDGWFVLSENSSIPSHTSKIASLLQEVLIAFISDDVQLKSTTTNICSELVNCFIVDHEPITTKLFKLLSSSISMEIDWNHVAGDSASLAEIINLLSLIAELLPRAAEMVSVSLASRYTYDDALLLVALLEIGHFSEDVHLPISTWVDTIPQLQAMLRRFDFPPAWNSKVHDILLEVARQNPDFEQIALPLTCPNLENDNVVQLANDIKLLNCSRWAELCVFSIHMQNLSFFCDDKWLDLLARLISEVPHRWRWWNEECDQNQPSAESYGRVMQSILDAFKKLSFHDSTQCNSEHSRRFYEKFGHQIQILWVHLCLPLQIACEIDKKALLSAIIHQMKTLKRDIQLLSKVDARILCSEMASNPKFAFRIPGMPAGSYPMILANPVIEILKTKTRPRRISFIGSDGVTYSYLLKGKEDLNVDQRILQVASYVNRAISKSSKLKSAGFSSIPTYSVTCLSPEVGLISIVPDTISLFRLNRFGPGSDRDSPESQSSDRNDQNDFAESTPAQLYIFNLHKILEERKLSSKIPRSEWPLDLYRELYDRLLLDSDESILEKRLYLSSLSPEQEFLKRVVFTATSATSSMLGYILGIGDRHLGNILLRVETGEVVHIDFAVSFDAGRSLRIPETVPFRLTPCIRRALGPFALPMGQFAHIMKLTHDLCRRSKPYILSILRALWNHPIEGWNSRRRRIMARDGDRLMIHNLIVARLQRSRPFLESLHHWVLGNQSRWLDLVASYNRWAVSYNELALKAAEVSVWQRRTSAAEQAVLVMPDLLEKQIQLLSELRTLGGRQEVSLKQQLLHLDQQQSSARESIKLLSQYRRQLKESQEALAALTSTKQVAVQPVLLKSDLEVLATLQNMWTNIRPLLVRISQDDFPVVQQLRSEWDQLEENIQAISNTNEPKSATVKLIDGRKAFISFFATLKCFIKTDLPNLPSVDPRTRAATAISNVSTRIVSAPEDLVQDLISHATDKDNIPVLVAKDAGSAVLTQRFEAFRCESVPGGLLLVMMFIA